MRQKKPHLTTLNIKYQMNLIMNNFQDKSVPILYITTYMLLKIVQTLVTKYLDHFVIIFLAKKTFLQLIQTMLLDFDYYLKN